MSKHRRFRPLACALVLCALTVGTRAEAVYYIDPILATYWAYPSLELGNAHKIAVGKFNNIHATFVHKDTLNSISEVIYVYYEQANNTWIDYFVSSDSVSSLPALAVDKNGTAAIAWVSKPASNPLGSIYYAYQWQNGCPTCWTAPFQIVYFGTEPSMAIENRTVHLAWTTRDRVQYTSFPLTSPPSTPLWMGEVVESTNCSRTRFHQPSIAVAYPPCEALSVQIAYLLAANEQSSAGSCQSADTEVGPRVVARDATTQTWSTVFQEVVSDPTPNQPDPVAHSLSLSATRATGDFYLAWSDEQDQTPRTRVAHGNGINWGASEPVDSMPHHVHVAAKSNSMGHFRLALSDLNWSSGDATMTGKWSGGTLTWTGIAPIPDNNYPLVTSSQALYWRRCTNSQLTERKVYTEAFDWTSYEVATDVTQTGPVNCRFTAIGTAVPLPDCWQVAVSIGRMALASGGDAVAVDTGDAALVTKLSDTGAEITTLGGKVLRATWAPGSVISSWENGFIVATRPDSVRFAGEGVNFTVEDVGSLGTLGGK